MFSKLRFAVQMVLIIFTLVLGVGMVEAAWWDQLRIPVPQNTQESKREKRMIAGIEFDFIYYSSALDAQSIEDFYRSGLANAGWTEKELMKEVNKMPGFQTDPAMAEILKHNLVFSKEDLQLIINFLPSIANAAGKTKFSVCYGKVGKPTEISQKEDFMPRLLTKPKKDVAPVYPGANLVTLSEQPDFLRASYFTKDDIEAALAFYKANMFGYGWSLVGESPIKKRESRDFAVQNIPIEQYCPTCKNNLPASIGSPELLFGNLAFSNDAGDRCNIVVSQARSTQAAAPMEITTILVDYEKKK